LSVGPRFGGDFKECRKLRTKWQIEVTKIRMILHKILSLFTNSKQLTNIETIV